MGAALDFEWDSRDLAIWRSREIDSALARAVRLAGNQAIRVAQKASAEYVASRKMLSAASVVPELPLIMPGRKALLRALVWTEKISGAPVPLSRFPHIQTRTGVSVRVNRGGGTRRIKSAFKATMASGHKGVFIRTGPGRLPLREFWTSRVSDVMSDSGAIEGAQQKAQGRLTTAFARGIAREVGKLQRKGSV